MWEEGTERASRYYENVEYSTACDSECGQEGGTRKGEGILQKARIKFVSGGSCYCKNISTIVVWYENMGNG